MAKDKTFNAIDEGAQLLVGKRVFYQLTTDEGWDGANGKVPAIVSAVTYNDREEDGTLLADLFIMRPKGLGGSFDKENVPFDNGRVEGSFDSIQPSDSRN